MLKKAQCNLGSYDTIRLLEIDSARRSLSVGDGSIGRYQSIALADGIALTTGQTVSLVAHAPGAYFSLHGYCDDA
ncbi:hypothetical protein N9L45_00640 [Planctomycetota bacterium]|nr:hypothetical protein [Planctomycetota bacterium]